MLLGNIECYRPNCSRRNNALVLCSPLSTGRGQYVSFSTSSFHAAYYMSWRQHCWALAGDILRDAIPLKDSGKPFKAATAQSKCLNAF